MPENTFSARRPAPKNPWVAGALAVVPGLGHFYLGEWWKGLFLLGAMGGLELIGTDLDLSVIGAELGLPMGLGGFGLWAFSIWDAYRTARGRQKYQPGFNPTR